MRAFRLGGMVKAGSIQRASDSLKTGSHRDRRRCRSDRGIHGILPDLFREKQSVIATGRMEGKRFVCERSAGQARRELRATRRCRSDGEGAQEGEVEPAKDAAKPPTQ